MDYDTYADLIRSINYWNENRVPILSISLPDEKLKFHGVMRFYFQDSGQKVSTKCIKVTSNDTTKDVIDILIEKFRPDMKMLSVPEYGLFEIHENGEERKLEANEQPLLVQLEWNKDDREGRFLLRKMGEKTKASQNDEPSLRRKLSKKEKKKQEKMKQKAEAASKDGIAERLYNELPENIFTRSISNPEAVMKRRRAQKLEKRLQELSLGNGQEAGGTLRIFGDTIDKDVSYKTLLLSTKDTAGFVVKQILEKYGKSHEDPSNYCLVQLIVPHNSAQDVNKSSILEENECPLWIMQNHEKSKGVLTFHIRQKPADRRKKPSSRNQHQNGTRQQINVDVDQNSPKQHYAQASPKQQFQQISPKQQFAQISPKQQFTQISPKLPYTQNGINGINGGPPINSRDVSLLDFVSYLSQNKVYEEELCIFTDQPTSSGFWTVSFKNHQPVPEVYKSHQPILEVPETIVIKLKKILNETGDLSMGLSIIAAKGVVHNKFGIYIKNVVKNGAAALDGRLQAGDQIIEVDGNSLINVNQEVAAELMKRTGPLVTLKVMKQAATYHNVSEIIDGELCQTIPNIPNNHIVRNIAPPNPDILPPPPLISQTVIPNNIIDPVRNHHPPPPQIFDQHLQQPSSMMPLLPQQQPQHQQLHLQQQQQQHQQQQQQQQHHQQHHQQQHQLQLQQQQLQQHLLQQQHQHRQQQNQQQHLQQLQQQQQLNMPSLSPLKSPKKVSWVDTQPHQSLHTLIPPSPNLAPSIDSFAEIIDEPIEASKPSEDELPTSNGTSENQVMNHDSHQDENGVNQHETTTESLTLEDIDEVLSSKSHNKWLEDSAGVIGTQEVYNDPRQRIVKEKERDKPLSNNNNIEKLSFQEKLEMFKSSAEK